MSYLTGLYRIKGENNSNGDLIYPAGAKNLEPILGSLAPRLCTVDGVAPQKWKAFVRRP